MIFLDSDQEVVATWAKNDNMYGRTFDIAENEEIIGVYGTQNYGKTFKNFGFIVKTKNTQE